MAIYIQKDLKVNKQDRNDYHDNGKIRSHTDNDNDMIIIIIILIINIIIIIINVITCSHRRFFYEAKIHKPASPLASAR